jgi:hypothetical protein
MMWLGDSAALCIWKHRVFQKELYNFENRIEIYTEDIHNVLNCQNVAKHTEFYLG